MILEGMIFFKKVRSQQEGKRPGNSTPNHCKKNRKGRSGERTVIDK